MTDFIIDDEIYDNLVRMIYSSDIGERRMAWVIIDQTGGSVLDLDIKDAFKLFKLIIHIQRSGLDTFIGNNIADPEDLEILTNLDDIRFQIRTLNTLIHLLDSDMTEFSFKGYLEEKKRIIPSFVMDENTFSFIKNK
jgi:hypothetical protein